MRVVNLKLGLLSVVAGTIITTGTFGLLTDNQLQAAPIQMGAEKTEYLQKPIVVNGGDKKVKLFFRQLALRDVLRILAQHAGFNLLLDDNVSGDISVDLAEVTINQALETIKDYADLVYMQDDKTLIVSSKDSELSQSINQQISQMIPVKYINAKLIANILNNTVFADPSSSDSDDNQTATVEYRTNSVVIVGTHNDVRVAEDFIKSIDKPRESKSFKINNADVYKLAQLLQATVFNDGVSTFSGSSGGSGGGGSISPSPVTIITESFEEGSGAATEVQGASGEGGGGEEQTFTLRTENIEEKEITISPEGPIIIPDTRSNTITIMGTIEQIALAEAILPTLDKKTPQVAIETSLVEVDETTMREQQFTWGQASGQWATGFNNSTIPATPTSGEPNAQPLADRTTFNPITGETTTIPNALGRLGDIIGIPTLNNSGTLSGTGSALAFTSQPINNSLDFIFQLDMLLSKRKAKILANPTVVAVHNTEAVISITEEIIRRTTVTRDATGFTQTQVEIGEAGIVLNLIPKISADGYITLRLRPSVSTINRTVQDQQGNITTLLKRKDFAVQEVRLLNGQTLALGGLIEERMVANKDKIPMLADLPIVGALFTNKNHEGERVELLMLVTPRIMDEENVPPPSIFKDSDDNNISQAPVPAEAEEANETIAVKPLNEQYEMQTIDIPDNTYPIKQPEKKTETNAYTIDDMLQEFDVEKVDKGSIKKYEKDQVDQLLNEYLPKGSN